MVSLGRAKLVSADISIKYLPRNHNDQNDMAYRTDTQTPAVDTDRNNGVSINSIITTLYSLIVLSCDNLELYRRLAKLHYDRGDRSAALKFLDRVLAVDGPDKELSILRSMVVRELGCCSHASDELMYLHERKIGDPDVITNIGAIVQKSGNLRAAADWFAKAVLISPDSSQYTYNIGIIYHRRHKFTMAIQWLKRTLQISPGNIKASWYLCLIYLSSWKFEDGWIGFEQRFQFFDNVSRLPLPNRYTTEIKYRKVLVWGEQGVGDQIMFGSMLRDIYKRVDELQVQLDSRLIPLFRRSLPPDVQFIDPDTEIDFSNFDGYIAIGSLGRHFRPTADSFAGNGRQFLFADPSKVQLMKSVLKKNPGEYLVGISWLSANSKTGQFRSIALEKLVQFVRVSRVRFINLQYGEVSRDIYDVRAKHGIQIWQCPGLNCTNDLDGLASLIECCDEVVTIANSTAHLAGALGKKTTVILEGTPNWRWMSSGAQTPWYDSVRVFRPVVDDCSNT